MYLFFGKAPKVKKEPGKLLGDFLFFQGTDYYLLTE